MNELIAVIDDERDILDLIELHLQKAGYRSRKFTHGKEFLKSLPGKKPALIILDLMLPDLDGFEICRILKKDELTADIPIIMLTAKGEELDRVLGLELGADDYVTKPFSPRELMARVKAVLRRKGRPEASHQLHIGDEIFIDPEKHQVLIKGEKIDLTVTEFKILNLLARKKGWVFTRDQILDHLWGSDKAVLDRTIDVHIKHLRAKLGSGARFIKNIRGVGYKVEE